MGKKAIAKPVATVEELALDQLEAVNQKFQTFATEVDEADVAATARTYIQVKQFYDQLQELVTKIGGIKTKFAQELVPNAFDKSGLSTLNLEEGMRVTITSFVRASMKDKDRGYGWLRDNGAGDLIQNTVNASTLSAFAKSVMEEGRELPEELFTVFIGANTSVTATKK